MEVHASVDEADIGQIRIGQRVTFTVDAFPRQSFSGLVEQVRKAPHIIQNVVIYTVVIATENPGLLLLPGMTVLAEIVARESGETLTVPNAALRFEPPEDMLQEAETGASSSISLSARGEKATVWVLGEAGEPVPVSLMTGMSNGIVTEIIDGELTAGQRLVVGEAPADEGRTFLGLRFGF